MGPRPHFICCEVSFLIRTNVWNTTIMNKTFFKSTDDSFGKGFHEEKVNLYLEYLNKNKGPKKKKKNKWLALLWWKLSNIINLLPDIQFITMKYDAVLRNHCWFLLLTIWAVSSGASQVSPDEWKRMLLIPCKTLILVIMATLFMNSLSNDRETWGRG